MDQVLRVGSDQIFLLLVIANLFVYAVDIINDAD